MQTNIDLQNNPNESLAINTGAKTLIVACGALAKEILQMRKINHMEQFLDIQCLPASLHNTPDKIPSALLEKINHYKPLYDNIIIGYADCGTGGLLQKLCDDEGVTYMAGAHCYAFFTGYEKFNDLANQELGTFYLTDYLARHFDSLIIKGMGLDKYPEMRNIMFVNYTKLLYLAQTEDEYLKQKAQQGANYLNLNFEYLYTGYGELQHFINTAKEHK